MKDIKCIVWDLDNTLWDGTLLEDAEVHLKPGIIDVVGELDGRGILHSIASKNDADLAQEKLRAFGVDQFFLYPEIHWDPKSRSIDRIQRHLNIGMDTILFIDDQPFERDEVKSVHEEVHCADAADYLSLPDRPALQPRFITEDSKRRRHLYLETLQREEMEESWEGPRDEFLAGLNMHLVISHAAEADLQRAEELTVRTNQLNATAVTYSYDELDAFRCSPDHELLVCELKDCYGSYGKIGLALIETSARSWHLRMLLMSCRVMSRGVGSVLLTHIMQRAKSCGVHLLADFRKTERNRMMYIAYRFANFKNNGGDEEGIITLENDLSQIQPIPTYLNLTIR